MVDFLYIIKMNRVDQRVLERLRFSVESVRKNTVPVQFCVADISKKPLKDVLAEIFPGDFKYVHKHRDGPYNRSYNINLGVRNLVESPFFFISDIDIVYQPNHVKYHVEEGFAKVIVPAVFRVKRGIASSDFGQLLEHGNDGVELTSGNSYCSFNLFQKVRGFDEEYVGFGAEDDDFYARIRKLGKVIHPRFGVDKRFMIAHLWHDRADSSVHDFQKHLRTNASRFHSRKGKYDSGKLAYNSVNEAGWGL